MTSENPIISWEQGQPDWEYDDVFHFKCSMNGTRPASRLSWLLNGQPVKSLSKSLHSISLWPHPFSTLFIQIRNGQTNEDSEKEPSSRNTPIWNETTKSLLINFDGPLAGPNLICLIDLLPSFLSMSWLWFDIYIEVDLLFFVVVQAPSSMVEPYDPVLIKSEEDAAAGARYYNAQLGLRFKMQPHFFHTHSLQLEVTCVSRVGLGRDVLEGRAKWIVRHPAPVSPVSKWPKNLSGSSGGGGKKTNEENEKGEGVDEDDDDDIQLGSSRRDEENASDWNATLLYSGSNDGTAQSISDSESPSRRTQPVVGSYPGKTFINSSSFPTSSFSFSNSHKEWVGRLMELTSPQLLLPPSAHYVFKT